jgi:uncharacterized protein (DUF934 family)
MKYIPESDPRWHAVANESDGPVTPAPQQLLSLAQWQALRENWPEHLAVAVAVPNDADVESLESDLPRLALVALHFPKWVDGRAYSQARLLRSRFRFIGEIRATGDVVVDMLPLLARTGFDAVQLRADQSVEAAERTLGAFPGHYQADAIERRPLFARGAA